MNFTAERVFLILFAWSCCLLLPSFLGAGSLIFSSIGQKAASSISLQRSLWNLAYFSRDKYNWPEEIRCCRRYCGWMVETQLSEELIGESYHYDDPRVNKLHNSTQHT